ncbi:lipase family protein [Paraburkholderia ferrariae]|uniref:lipase family protein n=1 Tax=Paraburkholderia ferrariae TaxID=386056 RepID=UPI000A01B7C4|nr:lipase family protein [Paraburkholderia ferrariae]
MERPVSFAYLITLLATVLGLSACATSHVHTVETVPAAQQPAAASPMPGGYQSAEAENFIEFCLDLDSQDDHKAHPDDPRYIAHYDRNTWEPIYNSRQYVAEDLVKNYDNAADPWYKLYHEIRVTWEHDRLHNPNPELPVPDWNAEDLKKDPRYNGFGPFQSAWVLYRNKTIAYPPTYAIAIRGTVFSSKPSAVEDFLFHPVLAHDFLTNDVSFASYNGAAVHSGFAHATFVLLLDARYGVMPVLNRYLDGADTANLYIVGHSQGAAMATLVHAFLHYAQNAATPADDPFKLYGKHYALKSYDFAQPKPGNFYFAADFARYTQAADSAIVVNNAIDVVPQVPLTLQDLGDIEGYVSHMPFWSNALRYVAGIGSGFRGTVGRVAEPFVKRADSGYGNFYGYPPGTACDTDKTGKSWNFVPAGHLILVFGQPPAPTSPDASDTFVQHHAWTYRNLIHEQLEQGGAGQVPGSGTVQSP